MVAELKKISVLEYYKEKGRLIFGNKKYSAEDRLSAGNRFYEDFYHSGLNFSVSINFEKPRVDGGGFNVSFDNALLAQDSFCKALRAIDREYSGITCAVCLENREIKIARDNNAIYRHEREIAFEKLCRGLDCLVNFYYGHKFVNKHNKPAIKGFQAVDFWEVFRDSVINRKK